MGLDALYNNRLSSNVRSGGAIHLCFDEARHASSTLTLRLPIQSASFGRSPNFPRQKKLAPINTTPHETHTRHDPNILKSSVRGEKNVAVNAVRGEQQHREVH